MSATKFTGTITAMITPFADGKLACDDLARFTEYQIDGGIDGLAVVGTTGEASTLGFEEQAEAIRCVVATARGRVPVIAGAGANSTAEALHLTALAEKAGADAFLHVAPYYNRPTQEGLFLHFSEIAKATEKPILLYSIPSRCGVEIAVDTVVRLRERFPHVSHIKEAGGSCDRVDRLRDALDDDFVILSGDDALTLPFLALGAQGAISVASNLVVGDLVGLVRAALGGDYETARALHRRYLPLFRALFIESNPVPVKAALKRAGILSSEEVRLPLAPLGEESRRALAATLDALEMERPTLRKLPTL